MKFKIAKQNRIFQDVVEQVEGGILTGRIEAGHRLPAERDLCKQFGASRGTIREALRILEQKGLITIRLGAGGGAFVRERHGDLIAENLSMLLRSGEVSLKNTMQFLEIIEAAIAALAAKKATEQDVVVLKKMVLTAQSQKNGEAGDWESFFETDRQLQETLVTIADNPLYGYICQATRKSIEQSVMPDDDINENEIDALFQAIRMLVYAIGKKDSALAARQARGRVSWYRKRCRIS